MGQVREFRIACNSFVNERVEEIEVEQFNNNADLKKVDEHVNQMLNTIKNLLPVEHKHWIEDLENEINHQLNMIERIVYEAALNDGIELKSMLS